MTPIMTIDELAAFFVEAFPGVATERHAGIVAIEPGLARLQLVPDDASLPWMDVGVNQAVFLFTLALCAATAILFGLVPVMLI